MSEEKKTFQENLDISKHFLLNEEVRTLSKNERLQTAIKIAVAENPLAKKYFTELFQCIEELPLAPELKSFLNTLKTTCETYYLVEIATLTESTIKHLSEFILRLQYNIDKIESQKWTQAWIIDAANTYEKFITYNSTATITSTHPSPVSQTTTTTTPPIQNKPTTEENYDRVYSFQS